MVDVFVLVVFGMLYVLLFVGIDVVVGCDMGFGVVDMCLVLFYVVGFMRG